MNRYLLVIPVLLMTGLLLPARASAQTPPSPSDNRNPAALLTRLRNLTEQLDLTPDQKTQIDTIFKQATDDLQGGDLQNASPQDKATRYREIMSDLRQQVGDLLTPDQKTELMQKLQALRNPSTAPSDGGDGTTPARSQGQAPGKSGQNAGGPGAGGGGGRATPLLDHLKNNLDQLGLTADQQSQVNDLINNVRPQILSIRADIQAGTLDRQAARPKLQSIYETARTKLGDILTPDQQDKLRELMQQNPDPLGGGRGGNGNAIAPKPQARETPSAAAEQPTAKPGLAPAIGQVAPDFSVTALNGESVKLSSYNHKLLVLVLGSYTNPTLRDRAAGLEALHEKYAGQGVNFLMIYTRETHPAGGWEIQRNKTDNISIPQPTTLTERKATAERARTALNLSIDMATDSMDDKTASAYAVADGTPAYVIGRDGKILFRQSWLEPMALDEAIENALKP